MRIAKITFVAVVCSAFLAMQVKANEDDLPKLVVHGDSAAPFSDSFDGFEETKSSLALVKAFLRHAGLDYELVLEPWPRALRSVKNSDRALIFALLRTPEREDHYHWILPLTEAGAMKLYARKDSAMVALSQDEIRAGNYLAACEKAAAQCGELVRFGFEKDRILNVSEARNGSVEQLVLRGRADFMAGFQSSVAGNLKGLGAAPDSLVPITDLTDVADYLAAPKGIDNRLLARLLKARESFKP